MKKITIIFTLILSLIFTQSLAYSYTASQVAPVTPVAIVQPVIGLNTSLLTNGLRGDYYTGMNFEKFNAFVINNNVNFDGEQIKAL